MENKRYGNFNKNKITTSFNSDYFSAIFDDTNKLPFIEINRPPKLESLTDETGDMFDVNVVDDIVYSFDDEISSNFIASFSTNNDFRSTISMLSESMHSFSHDKQASVPDLVTESAFTDDKSSFLINNKNHNNNNNRCELNKLLKVDVLSPVSLGSSYQSLSENVSIDSSQSNQTMTSSSVTQNPIAELCVICNDSATGKHYGVSACEGCKGFFKRTIRKRLHYTCREQNMCPITERLRNRCQSCRFNKCLDKGMKVEAVQKERTLKQKQSPAEVKSNCVIPVITAEDILQNEILFYCIEKSDCNSLSTIDVRETKLLCYVINKQLFNLVMWAKSIPGFSYLERSDQMILLNKSWVEILITSFSFLSSIESEFGCIKMDNVHRLTLSEAAELGLQNLMIRILRELIITLKHLQVDQMEIACLKTIILFDSTYNNLKNAEIIKQFRYHVFDILKKYVSEKYPKQPSRIYKLLLKLPSVRGLTACFVAKMKVILFDSLLVEDFQESPLSQSNSGELENNSKPDLLYPLFAEMMKQKDYPYL